MALASSSSVIVRAIKETVFGEIPVAGNPVELRITGEGLAFDISKESSKEINKDRTVSSMIPVTANSSGDLSSEVYYAGNDPMLESVMQSAFVKFGVNGVGAVTTSDVTATTITASVAPTGNSAFTMLQRGQWFRLGNTVGPNAGKILRVSPTVSPTSTVLTLDPSTPAAVSSAEAIVIQSSRLTHGTTQTSWTLERENSDIGVFIAYAGMTPSKLNWQISSGALSSMKFDFMGKNGIENVVTNLPGTPTASPAYEIHSGVGGATNAVWADGAPLTGTYVKSVGLDFDNALRSQEAIGTLGAIGIGSGTINCTLSLQVYFANKDLFTKFRTNQNSNFIFSSTDADGNGYIITIPKANISTWKSNAGAKDQDQMLDITVTGLKDAANPITALQKVIFIDRIGAAVV
jgi:hypothetical protein